MTPDDQLTARALSRDTCIVLPTYNERENLPPMVRALLEVAPHVRLLVVDDASPDGTGQVADAIASSVPERVTVLHRQAKTGLGDAYVAGFKNWSGPVGPQEVWDAYIAGNGSVLAQYFSSYGMTLSVTKNNVEQSKYTLF